MESALQKRRVEICMSCSRTDRRPRVWNKGNRGTETGDEAGDTDSYRARVGL